MIEINLFDLRKENALAVYRSIYQGKDSLSAISENTGISLLTVSELANELVKREILNVEKPKQNRVGRPKHRFFPSHKYYCIFIDKQKEYFCTIGISSEGKAIERFDYPTHYNGCSCQEALEIVLKQVIENPSYKYCMAIYLLGDDSMELNIPENVLRTTKEDLIITSFIERDKIILFVFNGKCVLSLYSHLQYPTATEDEICEILNIDKIYRVVGNLYLESLDALQRITILNLENLIQIK